MMSRRNSSRTCAVLSLLLVHALLLAWGATKHSPSIDEAAHLPAGLSHWLLGRYVLYAVNPPLVRGVAAIPVLFSDAQVDWHSFQPNVTARSEFEIGRDFIKLNGERSIWYYTLGRWACIPFSLLGGWICYLWAKDLYGWPSGLLALSLWCFSPTILANGQMLTPDLAAASLGVTACYLFRHWIRLPTWKNAFLAGLALGAAEVTKFTWIILFGVWPLLMVLALPGWLRVSSRRETAARLLQLAGCFVVAVYIINVCYGFDGSFRQLGDYTFASTALRGESGSDNRFRDTVLAHIPVPLPADYLHGIDVQKRDFEVKLRSYLMGEWREGGWWYYYLVALAVKVPLGAWGLVVMAIGLRLTVFRWQSSLIEDCLLLTPGLMILVLVSSQTGFNHHMRYILPLFPFAMIWISQVVREIAGNRVRALAVGGCWLWFAGSSLWYYPHSLSYFNELAGGPLGGHRLLVDSNIDWGQDLLYLKEWLQKHPEARPLGLAYFGQVNPQIVGIEFSLPPAGPSTTQDQQTANDLAVGPLPGWYAISVSTLRGLQFSLYAGDGTRKHIGEPGFTYFQEFEPVGRAGYSIYIYHLTVEDVNPVRKRLGLAPVDSEAAGMAARVRPFRSRSISESFEPRSGYR